MQGKVLRPTATTGARGGAGGAGTAHLATCYFSDTGVACNMLEKLSLSFNQMWMKLLNLEKRSVHLKRCSLITVYEP